MSRGLGSTRPHTERPLTPERQQQNCARAQRHRCPTCPLPAAMQLPQGSSSARRPGYYSLATGFPGEETLLWDVLSHEMIQQQGKSKVGTVTSPCSGVTCRHPVLVRAGGTALPCSRDLPGPGETLRGKATTVPSHGQKPPSSPTPRGAKQGEASARGQTRWGAGDPAWLERARVELRPGF